MAAVTLGASSVTTTPVGTATFTPAVGDLIVAFVGWTGTTLFGDITDNNAGGGGLNWTSVGGRFYIRNSLITSATSTTFTWTDDASGTKTGEYFLVFKVTGMSRAGLSAMKQQVSSSGAAASAPTGNFGAAMTTTNPGIGVVTNTSNPATLTPRGSPAWTERIDSGFNSPTSGVEAMSIDSGETATSIVWGGTSASAWSADVIELDASAATKALPPFDPLRQINHFLVR